MAPTGQVLHDLASSLVKKGHDVHVYCSRKSYNGSSTYMPYEEIDGVKVRRLRAFGFGRTSFLLKIVDYLSFYLSLTFCLLFSKADRVVTLTTPPFIGLLVKITCGFKKTLRVCWIMDLYPDVMESYGTLKRKSWFYKILQKVASFELKGAHAVICLGEDMKDKVRKYVKQDRNLYTVPLWGDNSLAKWPLNKPNSLRTKRQWSRDEIVIMYSGNMGLGHLFEEFLNAVKLTKENKSIRWVFSGGGKNRFLIEDFIAQNKDCNIELMSYVPIENLNEHLCSADIHLASLSSEWSGCMVPSKLQGIFAVAKPVIFVGDKENSLYQWIQEASAGWCFQPGEELGLFLEELCGEKERVIKAGNNAYAFSKNRFSLEMNTNTISEIICSKRVK